MGRGRERLRGLPVLCVQHSPDVHRRLAAGSAEEEEEEEKGLDLSPNSHFLTERSPECHQSPPRGDVGDLQLRRQGAVLAEDKRLDQPRPLHALSDLVVDDADPPVARHRGCPRRAGAAALRLTAATDLLKLGMEEEETSNGIRRRGVLQNLPWLLWKKKRMRGVATGDDQRRKKRTIFSKEQEEEKGRRAEDSFGNKRRARRRTGLLSCTRLN